jgi:hypothetical protein
MKGKTNLNNICTFRACLREIKPHAVVLWLSLMLFGIGVMVRISTRTIATLRVVANGNSRPLNQ